MNLILVSKGNIIGGAQIFAKDLAKILQESKSKVMICSGIGKSFSELLEKNSIRHIQIKNYQSPISLIYNLIILMKIIKDNNVTRVYGNSTISIILSRFIKLFFRELDIRVIHHGLYFKSTKNPLTLKLVCLFERLTYKLSDISYFVSKEDEITYSNFIVRKINSVVIYNGVELLSFKRQYERDGVLRVVTIARHSHQKDYMGMFNAVRNLKDVKLTCLGDGPLMKKNIEYIKEQSLEDKIDIVGYSKNPSEYLRKSDVFLLLSNWEGLPISIIEAMNHKLPIIASDVGGVKEMIYDDHNGYLARNWNEAEKYIARFRDMNFNDYMVFSNNSYKIVESKFDLRKNYLAYIK